MAEELTPEMIESWKELGVRIHMVGPNADFWLVPKYTNWGPDDKKVLELTPEDFLKQKMILDEFPDSEIKSFHLPGQAPKGKKAKKKAAPKPAPKKSKPKKGKKDDHPF